jgi:hypothetical protein
VTLHLQLACRKHRSHIPFPRTIQRMLTLRCYRDAPFAIGMPQTQVSHSVPAHHTTHVNFAAAAMVAIVGTFLSGLPRNRQGNNRVPLS